MPGDTGTQTVTVKYFDPVDSDVANKIGLDVRKPGIYSGGYLTRVNDTTVTLSTFKAEVGDGTYQVRVETASTINVTVSSTLTYVILRWTYTGVAADDYAEVLGVASGSVTANDVIIGVCNFSGATLTGFTYTLRTNPNVMDLFLKVEPEETPSLYCRVRGGRVNYGSANYVIADQKTPLFTAPGSGSYIYLVQITAAGAVALSTPAVSPSVPDFGGLVTLAQVTVAAGATTITSSNITDVRSFIGGGISNYMTTNTAQTVTGLKYFSGGHRIENRTSDPSAPVTGQIWLRTDL